MRLAVARRALLAVGAALLAACGQKGPLYLPDKNAAIVTPPPVTPAAEGAPAQPQASPAPAPQAAPPPPRKPEKDNETQSPQ